MKMGWKMKPFADECSVMVLVFMFASFVCSASCYFFRLLLKWTVVFAQCCLVSLHCNLPPGSLWESVHLRAVIISLVTLALLHPIFPVLCYSLSMIVI